jgi:phosphopantothenoylcysteine decarboxylase/phosphopantothenate--cysteine ligase
MSLANANILLGVTGGIAAYKSPEIVRRLADRGASVRVVMTESACDFVKPLVFQAVSGNPVGVDLLDEAAEAAMGHIELARWADAVLIAPATANTLAKMAAGFADDLLTTLCLATRAPCWVAPAMNSVMWEHPATVANMQTLQSRSVRVLGPGSGSQACGETGAGRLLDPDDIVALLDQQIGQKDDGLSAKHGDGKLIDGTSKLSELAGKRVLITAGPTREALDPVRFLTNHSSGKMGFAIAEAAADAGAEVTLIAGPVRLETPHKVARVDVVSALEMHGETLQRAPANDIFIAVAAVADYRVATQQTHKIKKSEGTLSLEMVRNPDILADVASLDARPFCVGFAAETRDLETYARGKLKKKNLDMIVGNLVGKATGGFNADDNAVEVYWPDGGYASFASRSKRLLADDLVALLSQRYLEKQRTD